MLFNSFSLGSPLAIGAPAPLLTAPDENGEMVNLAELYAQGDLLVFFYPMAETPGCTAQACSLRNATDTVFIPSASQPALQIVGISSDSPAKLVRFKKRHGLPYPLLSDKDHELARAFGVPLIFGKTARQSFIIRSAKIAWRSLAAGTSNHAEQVANALAEMNAKQPDATQPA